jgi:DNA-binding MarR family transcriptional regulator
LLSEFQQLGDGCLFALSKSWAHKAIITHFTINVELFRRVYIAHSTVSGIVDRLEKQGMLARKPDPADGRANCIHPTQPVANFIRERLPALSQGPLRKALAAASSAERAVISEAVRRLRELLEEADAEA